MDIIIAVVGAVLIGFAASGLVHMRFKNSVFGRVRGHVGVACFVLFLSFFLFAIIGFNIWTITILPVVSLLVLLFIIRNAMGRLLEVKQQQ